MRTVRADTSRKGQPRRSSSKSREQQLVLAHHRHRQRGGRPHIIIPSLGHTIPPLGGGSSAGLGIDGGTPSVRSISNRTCVRTERIHTV